MTQIECDHLYTCDGVLMEFQDDLGDTLKRYLTRNNTQLSSAWCPNTSLTYQCAKHHLYLSSSIFFRIDGSGYLIYVKGWSIHLYSYKQGTLRMSMHFLR